VVGQPLLLDEVQELINTALNTSKNSIAVIFFMCCDLS